MNPNPIWVKEKRMRARFPFGEDKQCLTRPGTLTLTSIPIPNPKSDRSEKKRKKKNQRKEKWEGEKAPTLPCAGETLRRRWRRRPSRGICSPGLGQRSAAARPLDGGALTRWGARMPARGPAMVPWLLSSLTARSVVLAALRKERRQRENEERESGEENELGFLRNPATAAFDLLKRAGEPSIRSNGCK